MSGETPAVSILMPVYNAAATLRQTLADVRAQTFTDWELWMVNDCSTDDTAAVCDAAAAADERIHVLHLSENGGAGPARNRALELARGEWVLLMDADDHCDPDMLERAVDALREYDVQMVVWGLSEDYTDGDDTVVRRVPVDMPFTLCRTVEEVRRTLIRLEARTLFGYCYNKLYRRDVLREQNILSPNEPLYEDFLFNAAYAPYITSLVVLDTTPYHYMKRGSGLTARFVPRYFPLSRLRVQTMWELYEGWDMVDDEVRRLLGGIYARYIFSALQQNCDKRMGLRHADRRDFVKDLYKDPLFLNTVPYAAPEGRLSALLCRLLKGRHTTLCLVLGRGIHVVKTRLPGVFARAAKA